MPLYHTDTAGDHHISTRTHVARKEHTCSCCDQKIEKGETYTKVIATFDGYFSSCTSHQKCYEDHKAYVQEQERKQ